MKKLLNVLMLSLIILSIHKLSFARDEISERNKKNNNQNNVKADKYYLKFGSMEIIGRIEAPLIGLRLKWQQPDLPKNSFGSDKKFLNEITDGFPEESFLQYRNSLLKQLRTITKKSPTF